MNGGFLEKFHTSIEPLQLLPLRLTAFGIELQPLHFVGLSYTLRRQLKLPPLKHDLRAHLSKEHHYLKLERFELTSSKYLRSSYQQCLEPHL